MRVIVTLTIDGMKETRIEGESKVFDGGDPMQWDILEFRQIGLWLDSWRYAEVGANNHKSRVFVPWSSVLYVEEVGGLRQPTSELPIGREFGKQLRQRRLFMGLKLKELAVRSGVSASHIARIEKGERSPGSVVLAKIQRALEEGGS